MSDIVFCRTWAKVPRLSFKMRCPNAFINICSLADEQSYQSVLIAACINTCPLIRFCVLLVLRLKVAPKEYYNPVTSLLLADKKWTGLRSVAEIRRERGINVPYNADSEYRPIERYGNRNDGSHYAADRKELVRERCLCVCEMLIELEMIFVRQAYAQVQRSENPESTAEGAAFCFETEAHEAQSLKQTLVGAFTHDSYGPEGAETETRHACPPQQETKLPPNITISGETNVQSDAKDQYSSE